MGYEGQSYGDFVAHAAREHRQTARELANEGGAVMTENTKDNTPVDGTGEHSQHLRDNIDKKMVSGPWQEVDGEVYYSGAETYVTYANLIEDGWGLWGPKHAYYEIKPKNPDGFLKFHAYVRGADGSVRLDAKSGKPAKEASPTFAKVVMHPGAPGQHMFALGAALTEHQFPTFAGPILTRMTQRIERWR